MTEIFQIRQWLEETETKYNSHSDYQNGLIVHYLADEKKRLFTEMVTLKRVMSVLSDLIERRLVLRAVDDEPEYPGDIPDEMWNEVRSDRELLAEALRLTVRSTKQGIRARIESL